MVDGEEVTITENLGANQQFTAVSMVRSDTKGLDPYTNTQIWTDWDDYTGFSRSPDFSTLEFTAEAGYVYGIHYVANVLDGGAATTYFNSATVRVGTEVTTMENVPITRQGGGATGIGENVGRFAITKEVLGDVTGLPAQDFSGSFTVTAPDGTETPGTFTVQGGATWTSTDFPRGSTVHLSEVTPTTPTNIAWGQPSFSQNDFALVGGTLTSVTLTNEATVRTGVFQASKQLTGTDEAIGLVPDSATFSLDYAYDAGVGFPAGSGALTLDRDGTVATSDPLPVGALLRLSEAAPAAVDGAAWGDATITPSIVTISEGSPAASVVVTNAVRETTGGFSVVKRVTGAGAGHVAGGTPFTVAYEWATPDGARSDAGELNLTVGGDPVSVEGLPEGAVVHLSEVTPSPVEGMTWLDPVFSTNGFTIQGGTRVEVDRDNATALTTGTFEVQKVVAGSGAALVADTTPFTVDYSHEAGTGFEAGSGQLTVLADGETVTSEPLPYGAVVTLSEIDPAAVEGTIWTGASFSTPSFTIGSGTTVSITLINTIELRTGAFSIVKALAGSGADLVLPETGFTVHYAYEAGPGFDAGAGELTVRADGEVVTSEPLPYGAVVTFVESEPDAIDGAVWTEAAFSASTVTIGADTVVAVTLTNTIETVPLGETTPPSGTTPPGLAQTGGDVNGTLIAITLSVLAGGALVLALGRRRHGGR